MRQIIQRRHKDRRPRYGVFSFSRPRGGPRLLDLSQNNENRQGSEREGRDQEGRECQDQKGDKEERNQREKKRQENNRRDSASEERSRSKGLISTLALSSISHMSREMISYLDSGASNHMTPDRHRFVEFTPATRQIRIGKGYLEVKGRGTIVVKMTESCGGWTLPVDTADGLWVPKLDVNLISIRQLAKKGITTVCTRDEAVGIHDDGDVVFNSKVGDDVYYLETILAEDHMAGLSVEHDQEEPSQDDGDVEVIEARAYKSTIS